MPMTPAQKAADKKYNSNSKKYTCKYKPSESHITDIIDSAINDSGLSNNAWLRIAIAEKIKRDTGINIMDYKENTTEQ